MMPVLIEGPKEPGNDIDVFLQPLMDERALGSLLDLQPKEELQLTHHGHLELPGHLLRKLGNKSVRRATKD